MSVACLSYGHGEFGHPWCGTSSIGIVYGLIVCSGRERVSCWWGELKSVRVLLHIAPIRPSRDAQDRGSARVSGIMVAVVSYIASGGREARYWYNP